VVSCSANAVRRSADCAADLVSVVVGIAAQLPAAHAAASAELRSTRWWSCTVRFRSRAAQRRKRDRHVGRGGPAGCRMRHPAAIPVGRLAAAVSRRKVAQPVPSLSVTESDSVSNIKSDTLSEKVVD